MVVPQIFKKGQCFLSKRGHYCNNFKKNFVNSVACDPSNIFNVKCFKCHFETFSKGQGDIIMSKYKSLSYKILQIVLACDLSYIF